MHVGEVGFVVVEPQGAAVSWDDQHRLSGGGRQFVACFRLPKSVDNGAFQAGALAPGFTPPAARVVEGDVGARLIQVLPLHLLVDLFKRDLLVREWFGQAHFLRRWSRYAQGGAG